MVESEFGIVCEWTSDMEVLMPHFIALFVMVTRRHRKFGCGSPFAAVWGNVSRHFELPSGIWRQRSRKTQEKVWENYVILSFVIYTLYLVLLGLLYQGRVDYWCLYITCGELKICIQNLLMINISKFITLENEFP